MSKEKKTGRCERKLTKTDEDRLDATLKEGRKWRTKREKKKKTYAARGNVAIPTTTRWRRRPLAALGSRFGAQCMLSSACLQQGEERSNKARKCREYRFSSRSWVVWPDVALRLLALLQSTQSLLRPHTYTTFVLVYFACAE